jgi:hypothetical protein
MEAYFKNSLFDFLGFGGGIIYPFWILASP